VSIASRYAGRTAPAPAPDPTPRDRMVFAARACREIAGRRLRGEPDPTDDDLLRMFAPECWHEGLRQCMVATRSTVAHREIAARATKIFRRRWPGYSHLPSAAPHLDDDWRAAVAFELKLVIRHCEAELADLGAK